MSKTISEAVTEVKATYREGVVLSFNGISRVLRQGDTFKVTLDLPEELVIVDDQQPEYPPTEEEMRRVVDWFITEIRSRVKGGRLTIVGTRR